MQLLVEKGRHQTHFIVPFVGNCAVYDCKTCPSGLWSGYWRISGCIGIDMQLITEAANIWVHVEPTIDSRVGRPWLRVILGIFINDSIGSGSEPLRYHIREEVFGLE